MKIQPLMWVAFLSAAPLLHAAEPLELKDESGAKWGWQAFGHGVDDSGVNASEGFFWVATNWPNSTWGNGMFFKKATGPIDVTAFKKVSIRASSQSPSGAKIRIELLTADNAVFGTDPATPFELKPNEETLIEAEIASMVPVQAEAGQRAFVPGEDLKKIDRIQVLFLKPEEASEMKNVLKFKDMKLLP